MVVEFTQVPQRSPFAVLPPPSPTQVVRSENCRFPPPYHERPSLTWYWISRELNTLIYKYSKITILQFHVKRKTAKIESLTGKFVLKLFICISRECKTMFNPEAFQASFDYVITDLQTIHLRETRSNPLELGQYPFLKDYIFEQNIDSKIFILPIPEPLLFHLSPHLFSCALYFGSIFRITCKLYNFSFSQCGIYFHWFSS